MNKAQQMIHKKLQELASKRVEIESVRWNKKRGGTLIVNMEDSHLLNVIKKVLESKVLADAAPWCEEIQMFEEYTYTQWLSYLKVEYLYRKTLEAYKLETTINEWRELEDLLNDNPTEAEKYSKWEEMYQNKIKRDSNSTDWIDDLKVTRDSSVLYQNAPINVERNQDTVEDWDDIPF